MSDTGTIDNPYTLAEALSSPRLAPGDTLLLRGGTYTGTFTSTIQGWKRPITIRNYPGEQPVIDGGLVIEGRDTGWQGIRIHNSSWVTRNSAEAGSFPADITQPFGVNVLPTAHGTVLANLTIHDTAQGVFVGRLAQDVRIYGCLVFNNGWIGPDRTHGHGLYVQSGSNARLLKHNIILPGISTYGICAYDEGAGLHQTTVEGNIHARRRLLVGALNHGSSGVVLKDNCIFGGDVLIGYGDVDSIDVLLTNNLIRAGTTVKRFAQLTATGNVIQAGNAITIEEPAGGTASTLDNTFMTAGLDTVVVTPNAYDANRAQVAIFNNAQAASVSVDIAALGWAAGTVRVTNAYDPLNDYDDVAYDGGGVITVSMTGRSAATPFAMDDPLLPWLNEFGAFLLERTS
jgi:hypothetical protein